MIRNISLFTALLILVTAWPAAAQYEVDDKSTFALRLGLFRPSDDTLKRISSTWAGPALDWLRTYDAQDRPTSYISAAFYTAEDGPFSLRIAPISYSRIHRFSENERAWYVGAGAGLNFLKLKTFQSSDSAMKLSTQVMAGYELSPNYFAEYQHNWTPDWEGVGWSGSFLYFGSRTSF